MGFLAPTQQVYNTVCCWRLLDYRAGSFKFRFKRTVGLLSPLADFSVNHTDCTVLIPFMLPLSHIFLIFCSHHTCLSVLIGLSGPRVPKTIEYVSVTAFNKCSTPANLELSLFLRIAPFCGSCAVCAHCDLGIRAPSIPLLLDTVIQRMSSGPLKLHGLRKG